MYYEYHFFKEQSNKLLDLQEDYRTYIGAVSKILNDYNKIKEKDEEAHVALENPDDKMGDQKKKELNEESDEEPPGLEDIFFFYDEFPKGAQVISSDQDFDDSFFVINRDLHYLRDSALEFMNNQENTDELLDGFDWSDWCEYTEYGLSKIFVSARIRKRAEQMKKMPQQIKKTAPTLKKTKKVSSYENFQPRVASKKPVVKDTSGIRLSWPIERSRFWISSLYGPRKKRSGAWGFHYGVDMAALNGTPVCAAYTGIIIEARYASGYGNTIVIAHNRKYKTRYAHLSEILVDVGQKVARGQLIGKVGDTGYVRRAGKDGSHLHFELSQFGKKVNPLKYIS